MQNLHHANMISSHLLFYGVKWLYSTFTLFCSQDALEGGITIKTSPWREAKSLMTGHSHLEGVQTKKQINKAISEENLWKKIISFFTLMNNLTNFVTKFLDLQRKFQKRRCGNYGKANFFRKNKFVLLLSFYLSNWRFLLKAWLQIFLFFSFFAKFVKE